MKHTVILRDEGLAAVRALCPLVCLSHSIQPAEMVAEVEVHVQKRARCLV